MFFMHKHVYLSYIPFFIATKATLSKMNSFLKWTFSISQVPKFNWKLKFNYTTWVPLDAITCLVHWSSMWCTIWFLFAPWHKITCYTKYWAHKHKVWLQDLVKLVEIMSMDCLLSTMVTQRLGFVALLQALLTHVNVHTHIVGLN